MLKFNNEYADDITLATTDSNVIEMVKDSVPNMLKEANLHVNKSKTEEYAIPYHPRNHVLYEHNYSKHPEQDQWKKCKLLGSHIDTETDIKHRRGIVISNMKNFSHIYSSKHLSIQTKVRHFNCFQTSIFLYNCSLWTLTDTQIKAIDSFHRRLLRWATGFRYPKKISNDDIYKLTEEKPWSTVISDRRLRLLGHICRLQSDTPARQSLQEAMKPHKRKMGRPKMTWIKQLKQDLGSVGIIADEDFENVFKLASDRDIWREATCIMAGNKSHCVLTSLSIM